MIFLTLWLWAIAIFSLDLNLEKFLIALSGPFHRACLDHLPKTTPWPFLYGALVCGATPPLGRELVTFQITGLYHLLVVSGSHLIFLSRWLAPLTRLPGGRVLLYLALNAYVLICQGAEPVVRALVQLMIGDLVRWRRWNWSAAQIALASGITCLGFFSSWILSVSFWLSWLASLVCAFAGQTRWRAAFRVAVIQGVLLPVFSGSSFPLTVVSNWLIGPLLGQYLLIVCLAAVLAPSLVPIADGCWQLILWTLEILSALGTLSGFQFHLGMIIIYVSALNAGWLLWEKFRSSGRL